MLPQVGYNVGFPHLLVEVLQVLDVSKVLLLVCVLREGNGDMFTSNPLIEVVFDLDSESMSNEEKSKCEDLQQSKQGQGLTTRASHLRRTQGGSHHHPFCLRTRSCWWVSGWRVRGISPFSAPYPTPARSGITTITWNREKGNMPYKYNEPRQGVVQPCHELRVWKLVYPGKMRRPHRVSRLFSHALKLVWHGQ